MFNMNLQIKLSIFISAEYLDTGTKSSSAPNTPKISHTHIFESYHFHKHSTHPLA